MVGESVSRTYSPASGGSSSSSGQSAGSSAADYSSSLNQIAAQAVSEWQSGADIAAVASGALSNGQAQFPSLTAKKLANDLSQAIYAQLGPAKATAAQELVTAIAASATTAAPPTATATATPSSDPLPSGRVQNEVDTAATPAPAPATTPAPAAESKTRDKTATPAPASSSDSSEPVDISALLSQYGVPNGEGMAAFAKYLDSAKKTERGMLLVNGFADFIVKNLTVTDNDSIKITDGETARAYALMKKTFKAEDITSALSVAVTKQNKGGTLGGTGLFSFKNRKLLQDFTADLQAGTMPSITSKLEKADAAELNLFKSDLNKGITSKYTISYDFKPYEGALTGFTASAAESDTVNKMLATPSGAVALLQGLSGDTLDATLLAFGQAWQAAAASSASSPTAKTQLAQYAAVDTMLAGAEAPLLNKYVAAVRQNLKADAKTITIIKADNPTFDAEAWANPATAATVSASKISAANSNKFNNIIRNMTGKDFSNAAAEVDINVQQSINDYNLLSDADKKDFQSYVFAQLTTSLQTHANGTFKEPDIPYWLRAFEVVKYLVGSNTKGDTAAKSAAIGNMVNGANNGDLKKAFKKVFINSNTYGTDAAADSAFTGMLSDSSVRAAVDNLSTGSNGSFSKQMDAMKTAELRTNSNNVVSNWESFTKETDATKRKEILKLALTSDQALSNFGSGQHLAIDATRKLFFDGAGNGESMIALVKEIDGESAKRLAKQVADRIRKGARNDDSENRRRNSRTGLSIDPFDLMLFDALKNLRSTDVKPVVDELKTTIEGGKTSNKGHDSKDNGGTMIGYLQYGEEKTDRGFKNFYDNIGEENFKAFFSTDKTYLDFAKKDGMTEWMKKDFSRDLLAKAIAEDATNAATVNKDDNNLKDYVATALNDTKVKAFYASLQAAKTSPVSASTTTSPSPTPSPTPESTSTPAATPTP